MRDAAILIIDVLNTFDFPGGEALALAAETIVEPIASLRAQADKAEVPVIYVNDNYGRWLDDRDALIAHLTGDDRPGAELGRRLLPGADDYFVVKPESSGFYATTLPALLPRLGVTRLVLTGLAADMCVLFTASDAHMREYDLWVPADTIAAERPERTAWARELMDEGLSAETRPVADLRLADWLAAPRRVSSAMT